MSNLIKYDNSLDSIPLVGGLDYRGLRTTKGWVIYWNWRMDKLRAMESNINERFDRYIAEGSEK